MLKYYGPVFLFLFMRKYLFPSDSAPRTSPSPRATHQNPTIRPNRKMKIWRLEGKTQSPDTTFTVVKTGVVNSNNQTRSQKFQLDFSTTTIKIQIEIKCTGISFLGSVRWVKLQKMNLGEGERFFLRQPQCDQITNTTYIWQNVIPFKVKWKFKFCHSYLRQPIPHPQLIRPKCLDSTFTNLRLTLRKTQKQLGAKH